MKNISLVIGSTGLIGKKLLFELDKKGDEVIAVSRRPIQGIPSNINVLVIDFNHFIKSLPLIANRIVYSRLYSQHWKKWIHD